MYLHTLIFPLQRIIISWEYLSASEQTHNQIHFLINSHPIEFFNVPKIRSLKLSRHNVKVGKLIKIHCVEGVCFKERKNANKQNSYTYEQSNIKYYRHEKPLNTLLIS